MLVGSIPRPSQNSANNSKESVQIQHFLNKIENHKNDTPLHLQNVNLNIDSLTTYHEKRFPSFLGAPSPWGINLFEGKTFKNIIFSNCDFSHLNLRHTTFEHVRFDNCIFHGTAFDYAILRNVQFTQAKVSETSFHASQLIDVEFNATQLLYNYSMCKQEMQAYASG